VNERARGVICDEKLVTEKRENLLNSCEVGDIERERDEGEEHRGGLRR